MATPDPTQFMIPTGFLFHVHISIITILSLDGVGLGADGSRRSDVPRRTIKLSNFIVEFETYLKNRTEDTTTATRFIVLPTEKVTAEIPVSRTIYEAWLYRW